MDTSDNNWYNGTINAECVDLPVNIIIICKKVYKLEFSTIYSRDP